MTVSTYFHTDQPPAPFHSGQEYLDTLFACVDFMLTSYLADMKVRLVNDNGSYKNVLYPDLVSAYDSVLKRMEDYIYRSPQAGAAEAGAAPSDEGGLGSPTDLADVYDEDEETRKFAELLGLDEDDDLAGFFGDFQEAGNGNGSLATDEFGNQTKESALLILTHIHRRLDVSDKEGMDLRFHHLTEVLHLSPFSTFCLAMAMMSCTQTSYGAAFNIINQSSGLSYPTVEGACRVFYGSAFQMGSAYGEMSRTLEELSPMIRFNTAENQQPFTSPMIPDKRLIDYLFGSEPKRIDPQYARFCYALPQDEALDPFLANQNILEGLEISYDNGVKIFALSGDEGSGRRFTVRHFCQKRDYAAINLDAGKLFGYDFRFVERTLWGIARECILSHAVICMDNLDYHEEEKDKIFGYMDLSFSLLEKHTPAVFTLSEFKFPLRECCTFPFTAFDIPTPTNKERVELWEHYAAGYTFDDDIDMEEMATKFLFTGGKIKNSIQQGLALSQINKKEKIDRDSLFNACYNQMKHELTTKATKVKATYTWDDIIMPADQRQTLEYVCYQMKYRKQVYEGWNYNRKYPYGRGLSVLLFGHPGTGKTMCAQVLANALNLELYRVDLSKVIDKYVGETEKSISMIFREAKKCNVVLFFDEADTMFGKRTDSGGSGESAANNKTAHLLQEVEAYDGVTVLATNFKHNIDPAFFRRMKFIVEFAFPDPETRYRIWKATIPKETPLDEDVDLRFLADRFEFVGGNIKNCILNAAFFAAADGDGNMMSMKHLLLSIKYELIKTGKVFTRTDFEPYANLIM